MGLFSRKPKELSQKQVAMIRKQTEAAASRMSDQKLADHIDKRQQQIRREESFLVSGSPRRLDSGRPKVDVDAVLALGLAASPDRRRLDMLRLEEQILRSELRQRRVLV